MDITRTSQTQTPLAAELPETEPEIPEGLELFAGVVDLRSASPYFRSAIVNPALPGLLMADGLARGPHAPLIHAGGLAGHYPIGTGLLARRLAELEGRDITDEAEARAAIDLNAAAEGAAEADRNLSPDEIRARTFQATTDHNIKVGQKAIKLANAAVPVLNTLGATRGLDFNTLSPGIALASTGMSAFNTINTFRDLEACPLDKTLAGVDFAASAASLVTEMTGAYKGVGDALKVLSVAIAFYDTARSGSAAILGLRPGAAAA